MSSVRLSYPYPELLCDPVQDNTRTGVRVQYITSVPETPVGSVQHPYNARNFCEFYKKFIIVADNPVSYVRKKPLPETSVGSVRKKYPYPKLL